MSRQNSSIKALKWEHDLVFLGTLEGPPPSAEVGGDATGESGQLRSHSASLVICKMGMW